MTVLYDRLDRTEHFISLITNYREISLGRNKFETKTSKIQKRPTNLKKLLTLFLPHTAKVCSFALKKQLK